jgi:hypothetical protein
VLNFLTTDNSEGIAPEVMPQVQYEYGSEHLLKPLPDDIHVTIEALVAEIRMDEEARIAEVQENLTYTGTLEALATGMVDDAAYEQATDELGDEWERKVALGMHLGLDYADTVNLDVDGTTVTYGRQEYIVATDDEADRLWNSELERYFDEFVEGEVPEHLRSYLDYDKWKSDARMEGRGHSLGRYDGYEYDETVDGTVYYIYKQ